jgi:hypothetical protein
MSEKQSDLEFDARIDRDGKIAVPRATLNMLGRHRGHFLRIRIIPRDTARALHAMGVSSTAVERIAAMQLESPERVEAFMLAEGRLGRKTRRRQGRSRGGR